MMSNSYIRLHCDFYGSFLARRYDALVWLDRIPLWIGCFNLIFQMNNSIQLEERYNSMKTKEKEKKIWKQIVLKKK